jgi:hypothetical protein
MKRMQRRSALAQEERRRSKIVPKPLTLGQREPMSAAGQERRLARKRRTSALTPKTDISASH